MNKEILEFKEKFRAFYTSKAAPLLEEAARQQKIWKFSSFCRTLAFILLLALIIFQKIWILLLLFMILPFCSQLSADITLKQRLMPDFLAIFGKFTWETLLAANRLDLTIPNRINGSNISFANTPYTVEDTIKGVYKDTALGIYEINANNIGAIVIYGCITAILAFVITMIIWVPLLWMKFLAPPFLNLLNTFNDSLPPHLHNNIVIILPEFILVIAVMMLPVSIAIILTLTNLARRGFRGLFIELDVKKNFQGETFWVENTLLPKDMEKIDTDKFSKVTLEDVSFNSKFQVYSTDQIEARYLLTTAFIERFQHIETSFKLKFIRGSFKDGKLYILMRTDKDMFAMVNKKERVTAKTFEILFNELVSLLLITDTLRLDGKTGL